MRGRKAPPKAETTPPVSLPPAPQVYYQGAFGRYLLSADMLLDAGWTVVDGEWIAPPNLLKLFLEETQESQS